MSDIKITLETLYDILRNEKKREDLQKLENSFYVDVVAYLREKKALLETKNEEDEIFASSEKDKLEYELRSIKRILKEIYEKREKKIIDIALNKSRTKSDIIDTSAMLREEKEFYTQLVEHLDAYRKGVLAKMFQGDLPMVDEQYTPHRKEHLTAYQEKDEASKELSKEERIDKFSNVDAPALEAKEEVTPKAEVKDEKIPVQDNTEKVDMTTVRFLHPVPKFIWKDMKEYGPYKQGEESEIYPEIADLLIRKGRAEKA